RPAICYVRVTPWGYASFSIASRFCAGDAPPEYTPHVMVGFSWPRMSAGGQLERRAGHPQVHHTVKLAAWLPSAAYSASKELAMPKLITLRVVGISCPVTIDKADIEGRPVAYLGGVLIHVRGKGPLPVEWQSARETGLAE